MLVGCDNPVKQRLIVANAAKAQIANRFKDPDSVLFRELSLDWSGGHLCGQLNAKNGFGAYMGFVPFRAKLEGQGAQTKVSSILTIEEMTERMIADYQAGRLNDLGSAMYAQGFEMNCSDPDDLVRSKQPSHPVPSA